MHRASILALAAILLATMPAPPAADAQVRRAPAGPRDVALAAPTDVPMIRLGGRPAVAARIAGSGPHRVLLDTGAAGVVVDVRLVEQLGLPVVGRARVGTPAGTGTLEADVVEIDSLGFGGVEVRGFRGVAVDLVDILGDEAPAAIVGPRLLVGLLLTYDFPAERIRVQEGRIPPDTGYPYGARRPFPAVPVRIGDFEFEADVDTGSGHGLGLPGAWAERLEFAAPPRPGPPARTIAGEVPLDLAVLAAPAVIAGRSYPGLEVQLGLPEGVANVGVDILEDWVLTVDATGGRFTLTPGGAPPS